MVPTGFIKACNQMRATRTRCTSADREAARKLGLTGSCKRRTLFMANADPFNLASSDGIGQRIEGIADQSKDLLDTYLVERGDEDIRNRFRHVHLPIADATMLRPIR